MLIFCGLNFEPNGGGVVSWHIRTFRIADVPFVHPSRLGLLLGRADGVIEEPFGCGAECPLSGTKRNS